MEYVICLCLRHYIYERDVVDYKCIGRKQYDDEDVCQEVWRWTDINGHSGYCSFPPRKEV